jgi:crotonobetainyl-CoA:carnitine CoA-transferase CaiB-like acyl-CoA transferase
MRQNKNQDHFDYIVVGADPRFVCGGFPVEIPHPGLLNDSQLLDGPGFCGSRMVPAFIKPASLIGEHTREICRDLLGMTDEEIEDLIEEVSLEVTPAVVKAS